jgi:hypothetical protein
MQLSHATLRDMLDPSFQEAYRIWRANPVTERVFSIIQKAVDSNRIAPPCRSEDALMYAGLVDGERELLAWLTDMTGRANDTQVAVTASGKRLEATYGVKQPEKRG